ncbi:GHKL domain-containing protein [Fulvivirga sp. RKSG066]|uniref:sensor histidine kinase n=1 Tax=Fulvivirga aurantia TaxID=2529383 RepID=UPI0012BD73C2|nr:ATP-binding protein [Fulvivirga aurantia]MTI20367.1 GHKL domain-containing protein [Fulvivirga aurantia]
MGFRDFRVRVALRVILIGSTMSLLSYTLLNPELFITSLVVGAMVVAELLELYRFISRTNRKLTRFLESVKYSDFASGFSSDNKLGKSFKDLNVAFNEVLEAFRKARSEKEEHLQYLNTIVEHVSTGLLSFDQAGNVELINATAKKFLKTDKIRNIEELIEDQSRLYKVLFDLPTGKSTLFKVEGELQLAVHATEIILRGKKIKLVALQNIQPELQKKELEAWQNLTKVLRHEIMNSITPIASLTSTMKDILVEDLTPNGNNYALDAEAVDDLQEGLGTIEGRSQGLIRFIDAYRDYTSIPLPKIKPISVKLLIDHVYHLMKPELRVRDINFNCEVTPEDMELNIDEELIEQILINLVKNSVEALDDQNKPSISIKSFIDEENNPRIEVIDNGQGIAREALEQIFIPFYTTKRRGSGIGLSLSRQIMQLHNGTLTVDSELGMYTKFILIF